MSLKEKRNRIMTISIIICMAIVFIIIKIIDIHYKKNDRQNINISKYIEYEEEKSEVTEDKIKVYITGEVKNQGVIELDAGSRIVDAREKAGGQTEQANIQNVNLAYELEDGQKIYIPNNSEIQADNQEIIDDSPDGIVEQESKEQTININKADIIELQKLPGIGESLATAIIKYREENGYFQNPEDLKQVPGIGESKYDSIKESIKIK